MDASRSLANNILLHTAWNLDASGKLPVRMSIVPDLQDIGALVLCFFSPEMPEIFRPLSE